MHVSGLRNRNRVPNEMSILIVQIYNGDLRATITTKCDIYILEKAKNMFMYPVSKNRGRDWDALHKTEPNICLGVQKCQIDLK